MSPDGDILGGFNEKTKDFGFEHRRQAGREQRRIIQP
jgi:hypothetical protein